MISRQLIQEIKDIRKKNFIYFILILTSLVSFILYHEYQQNGFQMWMYIMASLPFILIILSSKESKVLNILEKTPEQIKHIALEKDDGQLEIDVYIKDTRYKYSLNLPFKKGLEIAEKLMLELPNIDFYDDHHNKIENIRDARL